MLLVSANSYPLGPYLHGLMARVIMLCKFCQHFDFEETSSKAGSAHHPNWETLCASAQAGCAICELVQSRCRSERLSLNPCSEPERSRAVNEPVHRDRHDWKILQQNQIR